MYSFVDASLATMRKKETFLPRFPENSEVSASELLENLTTWAVMLSASLDLQRVLPVTKELGIILHL